MNKISNKELLLSYIKKYQLHHIFDDALIEYMELFSFNKGEIIFNKGVELKYMYFLVEGKIKIYMLQDNGKLLLIRLNQPLNILGDVELLTDYQTQCHVESLDESICIGIEMDQLRKITCNNVKFLQFIVKHLSSKLYTISNSATINVLYPLENRLASFLLSLDTINDHSSKNRTITIPKLTEIATLLGTSYRHLNRTLSKLVQKDIIQKKKGMITIKNFKELERLSCGNIYENNLLLNAVKK